MATMAILVQASLLTGASASASWLLMCASVGASGPIQETVAYWPALTVSRPDSALPLYVAFHRLLWCPALLVQAPCICSGSAHRSMGGHQPPPWYCYWGVLQAAVCAAYAGRWAALFALLCARFMYHCSCVTVVCVVVCGGLFWGGVSWSCGCGVSC